MNNNINMNKLKCPFCNNTIAVSIYYCGAGGGGSSNSSSIGGSDEVPPQKMILEEIK